MNIPDGMVLTTLTEKQSLIEWPLSKFASDEFLAKFAAEIEAFIDLRARCISQIIAFHRAFRGVFVRDAQWEVNCAYVANMLDGFFGVEIAERREKLPVDEIWSAKLSLALFTELASDPKNSAALRADCMKEARLIAQAAGIVFDPSKVFGKSR